MNMSVFHSGLKEPEVPSAEGKRATTRWKISLRFGRWPWILFIWLTLSAPMAFLHVSAIGLVDTPGISTVHALTAAAANPLGPWAGHVVRVVQFPNAGLRNFHLPAALGLTAIFAILAGVGVRAQRPAIRWAATGLFAALMPIWYGYGFYLIADGLL